jgi:hypothetical protein
MATFLVLRRHAWKTSAELDAVAARVKSMARDDAGVLRWIRSYVVTEDDGTLGTVSVYDAADISAVHEYAAHAGLPPGEVLEVTDTVVIRADPIDDDVFA